MRPSYCVLASILLAAALAAGQTQPAGTRKSDGDHPLQAMLDRLNSKDATVRDAARAEVLAFAADKRDLLVLLGAQVTDPQTKTLIANRIAELNDELAANPPNISLSIKSIGFAQVIEELNNQLGSRSHLAGQPYPGPANTYTLDVKDQPFWEIVRAIAAQHPIEIKEGFGVRLAETSDGIKHFVRNGPAIAYPFELTLTKSAFGADGAPLPPQLNMNLMIAIDPRLEVVRTAPVELTAATDELGHDLMHPAAAPATTLAVHPTNVWQSKLALAVPANLGKTAQIKCTARFTINTAGGRTKDINLPFDLKDVPLP